MKCMLERGDKKNFFSKLDYPEMFFGDNCQSQNKWYTVILSLIAVPHSSMFYLLLQLL